MFFFALKLQLKDLKYLKTDFLHPVAVVKCKHQTVKKVELS